MDFGLVFSKFFVRKILKTDNFYEIPTIDQSFEIFYVFMQNLNSTYKFNLRIRTKCTDSMARSLARNSLL